MASIARLSRVRKSSRIRGAGSAAHPLHPLFGDSSNNIPLTPQALECYNAVKENHMPKPGQLPDQLRGILETKEVYPIGTLAYYGPDDQTCTRISASVVNAPNARPQFRHWQEADVCVDPQVAAEIGEFFKLNGVQDVVMTESVIGCPHDEGVDYPEDGVCPHCPFWHT